MTRGIMLGSENSEFQVIVFCPVSRLGDHFCAGITFAAVQEVFCLCHVFVVCKVRQGKVGQILHRGIDSQHQSKISRSCHGLDFNVTMTS